MMHKKLFIFAAALFVWLPASSRAQNIFVNIRTSGSTPSTSSIAAPAGFGYSAAAPVSGTTWNNVGRTTTVPQNTTVGTSFTIYNGLALTNSSGAGVSQTLTVSYYSAVTTGTRTEPSTATGENILQPGGVMAEAWRNYLNASGNYLSFTVSNLPASTAYGLYFYGGTGTSGQGVGLSVSPANALGGSPTNGYTTNTTANSNGAFGSLWTVSGGATSLMPQGTTWNVLYGQTDASGVFRFLFNGLSSYAYLNGFQIVPLSSPDAGGVTNQTIVAGNSTTLNATVSGLPAPALQWRSNNVVIAGATTSSLALNSVQYAQDGWVYSLVASNLVGVVTNSMTLTVIVPPTISGLVNQSVSPGTDVTIAATVGGVPSPALQWQKNGTNLAGAASAYFIPSAQVADSGTYSLIASNSARITTNSMTLTVSSGNVPPNITGPTDQTVVQTSNATFTASVSGLPVPTLQWRVNGVDISGATGSALTITNVLYSQNGFVYSLVASNVAGLATNSASLSVLVPPAISQQPTNLSVIVGSPALFSVGASGVPAVKYQWSRNGSPIANATNASYSIANAQGTDNGAVFSVVVTNSVGSVTSSNAVLTVLSTMTGTFLPTNNATGIAPDQQLRIVFPGAIKLGNSGVIKIRDAANDSVVATIDRSQFVSYVPGNTSIQDIPNAAIRSVQGASYYYMPIVIYSNEVWITFTNRFAYNKTYYVNMDSGLLLDTNNTSIMGVSGSTAWRFSTKTSGPATPTTSTGPTTIAIGQDGTGDFATFQGAFDWIPQNNTLVRTIRAKPGIYRDNATLAQNRNFVTIVGEGTSRTNTQLIYPFAYFAPPNSVFTAGSLRIESSDVTVLNLTLDNIIYNEYHPTGESSSGAAGAFAGAINTLATTGKRIVFDNVLIKGGQDTIYNNTGIIYYNNCEVWGSVDYIYGAALAVFDQCNIVEIRSTGGPITAPNTAYAQPYGLVFLNCTFPRAIIANGYPYDVSAANTTFMRPWGKDGMTAIINCAVGSQISTAGWLDWGNRQTTCRAREYGTTLIGGGSVTPSQRQTAGTYWLNTIDPDYVSNPSIDPDADPGLLLPPSGSLNRTNVTVDPADYTLAAIFGNSYYNLSGWLPKVIPAITAQPTNKTVNAGSPALFSVAAVGLPDPTYQWRKNGTNISGATNATFNISGVNLADNATYSVFVTNSAGSITSSNAVLAVPAVSIPVTAAVVGGALSLTWPVEMTGYHLETQTNNLTSGLGTNWVSLGYNTTNTVSIPMNSGNASVFYRLVYP